MSDWYRERLRAAISALCALVLGLIAAAPCAAAEPTWPAITDPPTSRYVPGKWVWAELFSQDAVAATQSYAKVFGWSFKDFPARGGRGYKLALADGEPVGGVLQREHR
jgi:hypothetical protein